MRNRQKRRVSTLTQLVHAIDVADDLPGEHARVLEACLRWAAVAVPTRGIFEPGSRDEPEFYSRVQAIANRHLGLSAARKRSALAIEAARLSFKQRDAIATSQLEVQDISDTAYFYAGLAFALTFVCYGCPKPRRRKSPKQGQSARDQ